MEINNMKLLNKLEQEGNVKEFDYKGYKCLVLRPRPFTSGHLCGYVQLKETDKDYELAKTDAYDLGYEVHGGITFGGEMKLPQFNLNEDGYWLGFDCAHLFDLLPMQRFLYPQFELSENDIYRDINYVEQQCKNLVDQIIKEE